MATKFEKRLTQAAKEGVAIARGELDPATYRVHAPDDDAVPAPAAGVLVRGRLVKPYHKSGPGLFRGKGAIARCVYRKPDPY
jgi:hypothetical protein